MDLGLQVIGDKINLNIIETFAERFPRLAINHSIFLNMKRKILLFATCFTASFALAQVTPNQRILCGNEIFQKIIAEKYPQLQKGIDQTFEQARQNAIAGTEGAQTFDINVVVHIVWKDTEENLPDSVVLDQIRILNESYKRLNADTANLRDAFNPVAGSLDINFKLAAIERVETDKLFEISLTDENLLVDVKTSAEGGSDAWDTERYLNIWVCNIQPLTIFGQPIGQILGFAFPPAGLNNWPAGANAPQAEQDGVVLDFRTIGSNNPNPLFGLDGNLAVIEGRTAVHEVGHYLGLRHIWGDGGLLGGPNDCEQSDGIDDTPFANSQSSFDCDTTRNSCEQVETFYGIDMPDLVENYMDYSSESCQNMFSKGQCAHMKAVLEGPRVKLTEPLSSVQNTLLQALKVSPNPANTFLNLDFETEGGKRQIRLLNTTGQVFYEASAQSRFHTLATATLNSGLYFLQVQDAAGVRVQKINVQH